MLDFLYDWAGVNKSLFIYLNSITNLGCLPQLLQAVSSVFFIANFAVFYIIACIFFYLRTRSAENKKEFFIAGYLTLTRLGICYALFGCTFAALKFSVNLPRPFCSLDSTEFITIANTGLERCLSSFPSAHTGLSILVAYCLWSYMSKAFKYSSCFIVLLVATSRITLAMHYPADIVYSAVVTIVVIFFGNLLFTILKDKIIIPIGDRIFRLIFF